MNAPETEPDSAPAPRTLPVTPAVAVAVHNGHCQHYGICQQEAPAVFTLRSPTRLNYRTHPEPAQTGAVRQAARLCPTRAITVDLA